MTDQIAITINNANSAVTNNNSFRYKLPIPFSSGPDLEVCVASGYIYNSNFNINANVFNNASFDLIYPTAAGAVTIPVNMPNGFYGVSDINGYIDFVSGTLQNYNSSFFLLNSTYQPVYYISINTNAIYYSDVITVTPTPLPSSVVAYNASVPAPTGFLMYPPSGWGGLPNNLPTGPTTPQIVILNNNFGLLIGFNPGTYPASPTNIVYDVSSQITPEIEPQYAYNINSNLVNSSIYNSAPAALFQFNWQNTSFGGQLSLSSYQYQWYSLQQNQYNEIIIYFTDQANQPLLLNDSNTQITIFIRKKEARGTISSTRTIGNG